LDKKRKSILYVTIGIFVVGIILMVYLGLKPNTVKKQPEKEITIDSKETSTTVSTDSDTENNPNASEEDKTEDDTDSKQEEGVIGFVTEKDKKANYLDGTREKAEIKKDDYSYILDGKSIPFYPKVPKEWEDKKTLIEDIPDYAIKDASERSAYYKQKTDFTTEQKVELEKIKSLNTIMYEAYQKADYNTYLKNMYKGWREYFGGFIGKMIKEKEFKEVILDFYPDQIDTKLGYASGFMVKEITYYNNGEASETRVIDSYMLYKQNDKGQWELYYEGQL